MSTDLDRSRPISTDLDRVVVPRSSCRGLTGDAKREGRAPVIGGRVGNKATTAPDRPVVPAPRPRSEEHTSELQSLMRISYAVFCLKKQKQYKNIYTSQHTQNRQIKTN